MASASPNARAVPAADPTADGPGPDTEPGEGPGAVAGPREGHAHEAGPRTDQIVRRLKSVEGHVRGIERMVTEGAYCIDVVNQIVAVQRALKKVNALVLDRHLHTCVTSAMRSPDADARERVIEEIMGVFEASGRL